MLNCREIIELRSTGLSQEKVAFFCGCSTEKVRSITERAVLLGLQWPVPVEISDEELSDLVNPSVRRPRRYQPDFDVLIEGLAKRPDRRHFSQVWERYQAAAKKAEEQPYSKESLRRRYAAWYHTHDSYLKMRVNWTPGEEIQVDWAGKTIPVHGADGMIPAYLFVATSPYSGYTFLRASLDMSMQSWLEHHRYMFAFFGGTPLFLVPDNLRTGVTFNRHGKVARTVNQKYQDLADYYDCYVVPARVHSPRDKGAVEGHVRFLAGRVIRVLGQSYFTSINQLNDAIERIVDVCNRSIMTKYQCSRWDIFRKEEAPYMGSLPEIPFKSVTWENALVSDDGIARVRGVYYDVPSSYAAKKVAARVSDTKIAFFSFDRKQQIASHVRGEDGSETFEGYPAHCPDRFKKLPQWAEDHNRWELLEQWHPFRNEGLQPHQFVCRSQKRIWWQCPTCGYEWQEPIGNRTRRDWDDCPACLDLVIVPGRNDLATLRPDIAKHWHPDRNSCPPNSVLPDDRQSRWWKGDCGHEWRISPFYRTHSPAAALCPYCSGKRVLTGFNDLATLCPEISIYWHDIKNKERTPENTSILTRRKVYFWNGAMSDVWSETPRVWMERNGYQEVLRPFLDYAEVPSNTEEAFAVDPAPSMSMSHVAYKAWTSINENREICLQDWCEANSREDLLEEWDEKRNELTPREVFRHDSHDYWWTCSHGHSWSSKINARATRDFGCPFCHRRKTMPGLNDLESRRPQLSKFWHPTKNGELTPDLVSDTSHLQVWWLCPKCSHEWQRAPFQIKGNLLPCPVCRPVQRKYPRRLVVGKSDLATKRAFLAAQWHPTKNGDLTPRDVSYRSSKLVWWKHPKCGHEWQATVYKRSQANTNHCPFCSQKELLPGFNDLTTVRPDLVEEWHPTKNGTLLPNEVKAAAKRKVWWLGTCGHEWEARVRGRVLDGLGCPFCSNHSLMEGYNDLRTRYPEIAEDWHPTKNGDLKPNSVVPGSGKKVWWQGKCGHEWEMVIYKHINSPDCPYCSHHKILPGFNDLATVNPELAAEWHPTKNGDLKPSDVMPSGRKKVWWQGKCGHEWEADLGNRSKGTGCPICANRLLLIGYNDLQSQYPLVAAEWHPTRNGKVTPENVIAGTDKKYWWKCGNHHFWQAKVRLRVEGQPCPYCSGRKVWIYEQEWEKWKRLICE